MDRFTLTIKLGNEAMQEPGDVAEALHQVADILTMHGGVVWTDQDSGTIRDLNGNTVGSWEAS